MAIYLQVANISGAVNTQGYQGCIELAGVQHMGSRCVQQVAGQGHNRDMSHLHLGHVRIAKVQDSASAELFQFFCQAKNIAEVAIYHIIFNNQQPDWRKKTLLRNVVIARMDESMSASGAVEMLDLAYTQIQQTYRKQAANGRFQTPVTSGYNLEAGMVM